MHFASTLHTMTFSVSAAVLNTVRYSKTSVDQSSNKSVEKNKIILQNH